jgi:hypothetical protein
LTNLDLDFDLDLDVDMDDNRYCLEPEAVRHSVRYKDVQDQVHV